MYRVAATAITSSIRSSASKKLLHTEKFMLKHRMVFDTVPQADHLASVELFEAAGFLRFLPKEVADATNKVVGYRYGNKCDNVLTRAICREGYKSVAAEGVKVKNLKKGINLAVDAVIEDLKTRALMISTSEEITQVATISANGWREIGELLAQAMEKVGKEGSITIADGKTMDNELEVVEGMKLDRGYISPCFYTDKKAQTCELENPLILIHEKKISDWAALERILELAVKRHRPLLIVAEDVESKIIDMLIMKKDSAGLKVCAVAVKAPDFWDRKRANLDMIAFLMTRHFGKRANLDDIAVFTGGEVISEEQGMSLSKMQIDMLGSAKKVIVSLDDTLILHGGGNKELIEERCEQLRAGIENSSAMFGKEEAQERLSKLSGVVAVLKIGGASEVEVRERKDRARDALNATRAAVEEGIVPGGGVALLYATRVLKDIQTKNEDQKRGVQIIENALKAPTFTIVSNAGDDGALIIGKLLEQDDLNLGYDAAKGQYVNMVESGIIDPVKVIKTALLDAASASFEMFKYGPTFPSRLYEKSEGK